MFYYFRRSHGLYTSFFISFLNFITIQYVLLIQRLPFLKSVFSNLILFATTFIITYVPLCIVLGWIDYKKGSASVDAELYTRISPWARDLSKAIILIAEGKNEDAIKLLKRWTEKP